MSSIFEDVGEIAAMIGRPVAERKPSQEDQDMTDYTLIMDTLGDMSDYSTQVLKDVLCEIQNELDNREEPADDEEEFFDGESREEMERYENHRMDLDARRAIKAL